MANHPSALKRERQSQKRRQQNRTVASSVKTAVRKALAAINDKDAETTQQRLKAATASINRAASKGVLPKKRASRKISRLAKKANQALSQ